MITDARHGRKAKHRPSPVPKYFALKAWPTRVVGAAMLLFASPLIMILVFLVRITSPGPGLFRQARTGRDGLTFMMYKIRTMYDNAESVTGPVWCTPNDSRITPLGKLLRLLHLDELPQLMNVACGEMDLIGPRPERPVFVSKLAEEIPGYVERLRVLPGVTGLAQINLSPDESVNCVRKKLVLDCAYISEANLSLDFRILMCTFLRMIGIRHGRAVRWMRVMRNAELEPGRGRQLSDRLSPSTPMGYGLVAAARFNGHEREFAVVTVDSDSIGEVGESDTLAGASVLAMPRPR